MGGDGDRRRFPEGFPGFYTEGWIRSMVHRRGSPLVDVGGRVGRHGELIPGNAPVVSVDGGFTRERVGFSDQARKPVGGGVDAVHKGVGKRLRRACSTVPCRRA
jgi:hypothetical protein